MTTTKRRIVLGGCILSLLATPVVAYQFWDELLQMVGIQVGTQVTPLVTHPPATNFIHPLLQERVEALQKLSLDETFAELLEGQQYFFYISPSGNRTDDMRQVLSSRVFLKIFQQFGELPREQALEKLHQFSDRAIKEYERSLGLSSTGIAAQKEDPSLSLLDVFKKVTGRFSIRGAKYMLCTTMLLAARMEEYELLLYQMNTMQSLTDEYLKKIGAGPDSIYRLIAPLEDDCLFTILLYALERKEGKLDVDVSPFIIFTPDAQKRERDLIRRQEAEGVAITPYPSRFKLRPETIPLYRWNAYVTHFDGGIVNPNDLIEHITVYTFADSWAGGSGREDNVQIQIDKEMQSVLNSLQERLAE